MKFAMPVIFVKDIKVSRLFYEKYFSLEVEYDFKENIAFKNAFSLWQKERAEQIIFYKDLEHNLNNMGAIELYFETSNINKAWDFLNNKDINIMHELKEEDWGQKTFRLFDPDNNIVEVAEKMNNVVRRYNRMGYDIKEISKKTQMPMENIQRILKLKK
ncbi:MAG: VOC family protein [Actinomycetota bacterium]